MKRYKTDRKLNLKDIMLEKIKTYPTRLGLSSGFLDLILVGDSLSKKNQNPL